MNAKHHSWRTLAGGLAVAALAMALAGCSRRNQKAEESTAYGLNVKAQLFSVPPDQMSHIQVVEVASGPLKRVLRLTGTVAYNAFQTTPVITQVSGPVTRVLAVPGQFVRQGQPMLEVSSPDYAQDRANFLKMRDALNLADEQYTRARDLYAHHALALADLQQAETSRNQVQADYQTSLQALRILGVSNPEQSLTSADSPELPVRAPLEGEVIERLVAPGQVVQAGSTQVFTISNLSSVWVLANVYQEDLAWVRVGEPATIQTDAYPSPFHGRISYVAPALDPSTRTLQVRIETANPRQLLKKDMYVTAAVEAGVIPNALTVPDSSVRRNAENQPFVYVPAGQNQFAQRQVTVGESLEGRTQILSGLKPGERVVADGSLFLQFQNAIE
jgi:membrane fusion protein, heavy metal efflux system